MNKILAMWAVPRSVSTAFERMIIQRGDFQIFHEPFSAHYYFSEQRASSRFDDIEPEPAHLGHAVLKQILRAAADSQVFFKDMGSHVIHFMNKDFLANFENTFLIRDPAKALPSFFHMWPDFTLEEAGYKELYQVFQTASDLTGNTPVVIDADDLLRNTEAMAKKYCEKVGIEYMPESLKWNPGEQPKWKTWESWHTQAANSSGFEASAKKKEYKAIDDDPRLKEAHEHCLPYYQKLYDKRLKV